MENKKIYLSKLNGCISASTRLEDIYNFLKSNLNYKKYKMNVSKQWPEYINKSIQHDKNLA